jgi:hypothetical protein
VRPSCVRKLLLVVPLLLGACGTGAPTPAATGLPTTSSTTTTLPALPTFPEHGYVARVADGIDVLDLDLQVVGHIDGLEPMGHTQRIEEIWVRAGNEADDALLRLDPSAGTLTPGDPPSYTNPGEGPDLPPPARAVHDGHVAGHWTYALASPDGRTWLAQWSGECEAQTAWFVPAGGGDPRPAGPTRDEDWAFSSGGAGWLPDGRAIVDFDDAACGTPIGRPGSYAIALDGTATFLSPSFVFGSW